MTRNAQLRNLDGRWLAVVIVVAYFGLLLGAKYALRLEIWPVLGVPALEHPFHDLNDIAIGIERFQNGGHSWNTEAISYSTRAYNYTKWWLLFGYLGLNLKTVFAFAVAMISLFFISAFFVLGRLTVGEGAVAGLVLVSPNVMTAIERANADLLIFSLIALALAARRSAPVSTALITLAAVLKIYPAIALAALVRSPWRKTIPWLMLAIVAFFIDLATSTAEIHQTATYLTRVGWFSYGSTTFMEVYKETMPMAPPLTYKAYLVGSLFLISVIGMAIYMRPRIKLRLDWEKELLAFRIGAALFVGTFAMGSNLDYRTMVLIFCLPFLFALRKESGAGALWASLALFLMIFYFSWRFIFDDAVFVLFVLKQLTAWFLVLLLTGIYAGTLMGPENKKLTTVPGK